MTPPAPMDALDTLLQRAVAERDLALLALARAEALLRRQQGQLAQLVDYRREYHQRWAGQFSRHGAMEIVQCYQSFVQRLDEALAQQQRQVQTAQAGVQRSRDSLLARETRAASVRKLIERRAAVERLAHDRREQRQTDERAQQAAWQRGPLGAGSTHH
jgi:flagellar protein FliJ